MSKIIGADSNFKLKPKLLAKFEVSAIYRTDNEDNGKETPPITVSLFDHDPNAIVVAALFQKIEELENEINEIKGDKENGKEN